LSVLLYDESLDRLCWNVLDIAEGTSARPAAIEPEETTVWWVYQHQEPLVLSLFDEDPRFPRTTEFLRNKGVQSCCSLPLTTAHRRLGSIGFASRHPNAYSPEEVRFLSLVADQIALAVNDAFNLRQSQREKERLRLLLDLSNSVVSNLELRDLLRAISANVRRVMDCDAVGVALLDSESGRLRLCAHDFPEGKGFSEEERVFPIEGCPPGKAFLTGQPVVVGRSDLARFCCPKGSALADGLNSGCFLPLAGRNGVLGALCLGRERDEAFTQNEVDFLSQVASQIAVAVENALAYRQIADLKDRLAQEKLYLEDEIRSELNFEEIVGRSTALRRVLQQVETVAPTDSTVLIYGETGSGKELIARAIHNLNPRREQPFVKLNCAAIPTGLLESELFGHERGAFTGAVSQRIGRFELGSRGTVFLDEIGEVPLELQPKLLRVLQEREFERLGSSRTLRTDARLIAATNRDLAEMVSEGKFRTDLFYRLNVFPVHVPPLRERQEDIPLLVRHFVEQFSRRLNKRVDTIASETMNALVRYHWPGNIRELQNLIERAVILSTGPVLKVPLSDLKSRPAPAATKRDETLEEAERKHVLAILEDTKWVISGPNGAAARLGMKRSTLQFRMRKLGISRPGK
ncbi:MAG TPA: sigma 54-interacting transcriptional regulator, partial [Bryobacteraceae bacterium]|nr:sigma 54-interacting transcriptional regulator [Bryobacteraceae bacterium]